MGKDINQARADNNIGKWVAIRVKGYWPPSKCGSANLYEYQSRSGHSSDIDLSYIDRYTNTTTGNAS